MQGRKLTTKQRTAFLDALRQNGNVTKAAEAAGLGRSALYRVRDDDAAFAEQWDAAVDEACDRLEAEAWRRAVEGVQEPVIGRVAKDEDGIITYVQKYSDSLMVQLLKAHKPEKYKDRSEVKTTDEPMDWDAVPPEVRDAFIDGKMSLSDVRRFVTRTS